MELEEIRNKIIDAAIKDYNNSMYNVLNQELLENVLFVLKHSKGNALYSKEQAQEISKEIEKWLELREDLLSKIRIVKEQSETHEPTLEDIKEMNRSKNHLLEVTSSSIEDFYISNSHIEEVVWLRSQETVSWSNIDVDRVLNQIEKVFLKWQKEESHWKSFITVVEELINGKIRPNKAKMQINDVLHKYYAKIYNEILKELHDLLEEATNLIKKDNKNEFLRTNSLIKTKKEDLDTLTVSIKQIEPNFKMSDLFKYVKENEYIRWYKEQQDISDEEIVQAHLASIKVDASLEEKLPIYILEKTNERTNKVISKLEKSVDQKVENKNEKKVTIPTDKEFESRCQDYKNMLKKINQATDRLESNYNGLLSLEQDFIEAIKSGKILDNQNPVESPTLLFFTFDGIYKDMKRDEETIISLKNSMVDLEIETYEKYGIFPFNVLNEIEKNSNRGPSDIDVTLQKRKETMENLKSIYDKSNNNLEREVIKRVIVMEQGIMISEISRRQKLDPTFDGPSYQRKYRTSISFEEKAEIQTDSKEVAEQVPNSAEVIVKELKLNFNSVQAVGSNAVALQDEESIKISIAEHTLSIAFSKELKRKLKEAKYQLKPFQRQNKGTEKITREIEEKENTEIWSYDLTNIRTNEFYLSIIFEDLVDSKKNIKYRLIKKGVLSETLKNGEMERTVLTR